MLELNKIADVGFADYDEERIKHAVVDAYQKIAGRTLAKGDPIRLFLLSIAAIIIEQRYLINQTGKMNLLAYAKGNYLDHLGALFDVERIPAKAARVTVKYTLSTAAVNGAYIIPKGTRVTDQAGAIYFAVDEATEISVGEMSCLVHCTCTQFGEVGNGFLVGSLSRQVDPLPCVASVSNPTVSAGGGDTEGDDAYRNRIHEAPESFSDAGSYGAYAFFAKSANTNIIDVNISSPAAGEVLLVPLLAGGILPEQEILDEVLKVCSAEKVRPLTDKVTVKAPTVVSYDINASYYILTDDKAQGTAIQEAVTNAVSQYVMWQKSKLGRDIDPSKLYELMVQAGARKVTVTAPVIKQLQRTELAVAEDVTVTFLGGADE